MSLEIFPVVHIDDPGVAVEQSQLALENGADGVYLIDHFSPTPDILFEVLSEVGVRHPEAFVGINMLTSPTAGGALQEISRAFEGGMMFRLPSGLWVDNARRSPELIDQALAADPQLRSIRLLGGAAFKYTVHFTEDPEAAAAEASIVEPYVDVVTTSGRGTGHAPSPEKIQAMKQAIRKPLAVASGISADNLRDYGDNIDQVLVSTSIEEEPYSGVFNLEKLQEIIELAHS